MQSILFLGRDTLHNWRNGFYLFETFGGLLACLRFEICHFEVVQWLKDASLFTEVCLCEHFAFAPEMLSPTSDAFQSQKNLPGRFTGAFVLMDVQLRISWPTLM